MSKNYLCPVCRGQLRVTDNIIFSVKRQNGEAGLVLLSPEIGEYMVVSHPEFKLPEGEKIDIFCPICHADLTAKDVSSNLSRVIMVDEDNRESRILFSEIVGQRCTYKVTDSDIEAYGDDLEAYTNFFGAGPAY